MIYQLLYYYFLYYLFYYNDKLFTFSNNRSHREHREHRKNVISYVTVGDSDNEERTTPNKGSNGNSSSVTSTYSSQNQISQSHQPQLQVTNQSQTQQNQIKHEPHQVSTSGLVYIYLFSIFFCVLKKKIHSICLMLFLRNGNYSAGASQSQKKRLLAKAQSECMLNVNNGDLSNNVGCNNNSSNTGSGNVNHNNNNSVNSNSTNNNSSNNSNLQQTNAQNIHSSIGDGHSHCHQLQPTKQEPGVCDIQHHPCQNFMNNQDQTVYTRYFIYFFIYVLYLSFVKLTFIFIYNQVIREIPGHLFQIIRLTPTII